MRSSLGTGFLLLVISFSPLAGILQPAPNHAPPCETNDDGARVSAPDLQAASEAFHGLQGFFTENLGQVADEDVRFYAEGDALTVGLTCDGLVLILLEAGQNGDAGMSGRPGPLASQKSHVVNMRFAGGAQVEPRGVGRLPHTTNSFIGKDQSRWVRGARSFEEVRYEGLHEGIDLRLRFFEGRLKYEAEVQPGANPLSVGFIYDGVERLTVDPATGELLVHVADGIVLRDMAPYAYQTRGNYRIDVDCAFRIIDNCTVGFEVGEYDICSTLVIDPGLRYSSYIGGPAAEVFKCALKARDGSLYISGYSTGPGFPVTNGSLNITYKYGKGLILKMDSRLKTILYATYFGGEKPTGGPTYEPTYTYSLNERTNGSVVVTGMTRVSDFPVTPDALEPEYQGDYDAFIIVLSKDGSDCQYCSYFGGRGGEWRPTSILDVDGCLYMYGETTSDDLDVTQGAYCTTYQGTGGDVFIAKLDTTFTRIIFCTYFGGSDQENSVYSWSIFLDEKHCIYFGGSTASSDLPTTEGAYCRTRAEPSWDVFLAKMDANASELLYCTFIGGSGIDYLSYFAPRMDGSVVIAGGTSSADFPLTSNAFDRSLSGGDVFVSVLDLSSSQLIFSSYFGGDGNDEPQSFILDQSRDVLHGIGMTVSKNLKTTKGCYNPEFSGGVNDLFFFSIDLKQNSTIYCTYIGGKAQGSEEYIQTGSYIQLDDDGSIITVAMTSAIDFPTTSNAFDRLYNGGQRDGVIFQIDLAPVEVPPAPRLISAEAGDGKVTLQWEPVVSEEYVVLGYIILRGDDDGTPVIVGRVTDRANFTNEGLVNGHKYYYRVAAENSAGIGERSDAVSAVPKGVPSPPMQLTLRSGNGAVELNWSEPDDDGGSAVLGYRVMRGRDAEALEVLRDLGPAFNWTDKGVEIRETYYYAVVAFNEVGNGTRSEVQSIKVTTRPDAPGGFRVEALPGAVGLAWDAPADDGGSTLLGYRVLRGSSADTASMGVIATLLPTERAYTDRAVVNGTVYYYAMRAFTMVNESAMAGPLEATPYGPPGAPAITSCVPGNGDAILTWSPPSNDGGRPVTRYALFAGPYPGALTEKVMVEGATTGQVGGLENGAEVLLAVRAWNEMGWGPVGEPVRTTPYGPPGKPGAFQLSVSIDGVLLVWQEPTETGGASQLLFRIERGTSAQDLTTLVELKGLHVYLDRSAQVNVIYNYRVKAVNPLGIAGEPTDTLSTALAGLPGPVVSFRAVSGVGRAFLSWEPPAHDGGSPVERYVVKRAVPGREARNITEVVGKTSYVDEGLVNWQTYIYMIVAVNRMGAGMPSEMLEVVPMNAPGAPWDVSTSTGDGKVRLKWSAPIGKSAPVTGYIIRRGSSLDSLLVIAEVGQVLEFSDADVGAGQTYYYTIAANSTVGEGAQSEPKRAEPPPVLPGPFIYGILGLVVFAFIVSALLIRRRRTHGSGGEGG